MPRLAVPKDHSEVVNMAIKFANNTVYSRYCDVEVINRLAADFLDPLNPDKIVFIEPSSGMLAGMITPFTFGVDLIATEVVWWVEPDKRNTKVGKELLDAFEDWARNEGCRLITMISIDDALGKYYEKRGYGLYEHAYMKEL